MTSSPLRILGFLVLLAAVAGAAWQLRGCREQRVSAETPAPATRTDTVFAERTITRTDTVTRTRPATRTIYETRTDTVRDCYARPEDFDVAGLTSSAPLQIDRGGVFSEPTATLTTFDPSAARFEQATYSVPEERFELYPYAGAGYGPLGFRAGVGAGFRWQRVEARAGYRFAEGGARGLSFGLRFRPFTLDW